MDNLLILLLFPLVGALVLAFVKQSASAKRLALLFSVIAFGLTLPFWSQFNPGGGMQFEQQFAWIPAMGIDFHIGLDGISLPLVLLTNLLVPLIILSSFSAEHKGGFYALVLAMQAGLLLVFTALDAFTFYVGWEVALIPIYFICALWGGEDRIRVNIKFFIYTFFGSLLMLIAIIYLHVQTPSGDFALASFYNLNLDDATQRWIFWAFFIAFAIKMPLFPFHTWQPDTYVTAPTAGTMLLAGIMLKMGIYGLIRWLIPVVPEAFVAYGWLAALLGIIGVVYASLIAFKQKDFKRLIAYSSIAHVGLIGAAVFVWNVQSLQGAMIQMINHGISVIGLFMLVDILSRRLDTRDMGKMGGIAKVAPALAIYFLIIVMGAVGLPVTNGFIGEFLMLIGIYQYSIWYAAFGGLTIILGAVYLLRAYQQIMHGPLNDQTAAFKSLDWHETTVLVVVSGLIIIIGVYPQPLLNISEPAVTELVQQIGSLVR